ncbi:MAG: 4Fe-4S binding protein [Rhodopseudomonas palustris]|nr:4Fe-4S binding protein [Rhodopseudomonas palustris]
MKVDGYVGNFTVTIKKKARYVNEELCTGCGICMEKCPQEGRRRRLRSRARLPQGGLHAVPAGRAKIPGHRHARTAPTSRRAPAKPARSSARPTPSTSTQEDEILTVEVGNIILATGYDLFDARRVTQLRLRPAGERLHQPGVRAPEQRRRTDRRQHRPARRQDHAQERWASSTAWASRDKNYNNYCSAICCMQSLKFAHLVQETHRRDGLQLLHRHAHRRSRPTTSSTSACSKKGTLFVRGKVAEVTDAARTAERGGQAHRPGGRHPGRQAAPHPGGYGHPVRRAWSRAHDAKETGQTVRHLLLSGRLVHRAPPQARPGCDHDRRHLHRRLRQGPKDIPASVAQGAAAAARVLGQDPAEGESRSSRSRATRQRGASAPAAASATTCARSMPSSSTKTAWSARSTRRCARAAAPAWRPARQAPSAAPASATSRSCAQIDGLLLLTSAEAAGRGCIGRDMT